MARIRATQYTFTRGQLSADLDFRSDITLYQSGAKTVSNCIVLPQGGLAKRRGFQYIATTANALRVEKFAFSETQEYVLVFFDEEIKIYRSDVLVFDSENDVYVVTDKANGTYTSSQTVILDGTTISLTTGTNVASAVIDINAQTATSGVSASDHSGYLQLYNEGDGTSLSVGSGTANGGLGLNTGTYNLTSVPYTADQVPELRMSQKFDAMFIVQKDTTPYELIRGVTNNDWTLKSMLITTKPFVRFNVKQNLTPSATSGSGVNLTLTMPGAGTNTNYWVAEHEGAMLKVNGGYVTITSITSGLVAVGAVTNHLGVAALDNTNADTGWSEEAWSGAHGYPRTVTQHQARLIFGGTRDLPQTIMASSTGSFTLFDTDTTDDDRSWTKEIGTQRVNTIESVIGRSDLHIFTNDGHYIVNGEDAITPTAGRVQQQNAPGISKVPPVEVYQNILFITDDDKTLQLVEYNSDVFQYKTSNLTTLSQDLLNTPVDMAYISNYANTQSNLILIINTDGTGVVLSIDTEKEVFGWSKFTTNGTFISTAEIDNALYVLVTRTQSDSSLQTYLEKLTEQDIYLDHFYTGTKSGNPKNDWSGATTLSSQTVGCVVSVGDTDIEEATVHDDVSIDSAGAFNTDYNVHSVAIGHYYTGTIETLPLAFAVNNQLVRGERYRKVRAELRVRNTKQFSVDGYIVNTRLIGKYVLGGDLPNMDAIVPVTITGTGNDQTVVIKSTLPLPMQINGLTVECRFSA